MDYMFKEMEENEILEVEGGVGYIIATAGVVVGAGLGMAICQDLKNCYNNGYNSVMENHR